MPRVTEEHSEYRRRQIIAAAYRCFGRKGFHQTTMRDIYAEAGLSPGAIYHYFNSKDEIIEASFRYDHQHSLPVFASAGDDPDPIAAIDQLIGFFFAGLQSADESGATSLNIQGWGEALVNPRLRTPLQAAFHDFRARFSRLVQRAQAAGRITETIDPQAAAEVIISSYLGLYLQKAFVPDLDIEKYQQAVLAQLHGSFAVPPG